MLTPTSVRTTAIEYSLYSVLQLRKSVYILLYFVGVLYLLLFLHASVFLTITVIGLSLFAILLTTSMGAYRFFWYHWNENKNRFSHGIPYNMFSYIDHEDNSYVSVPLPKVKTIFFKNTALLEYNNQLISVLPKVVWKDIYLRYYENTTT